MAALFLLGGAPIPGEGPPPVVEANVISFENQGVFDEGLEEEAFTILLPEGWSLEGGIEWRPERPLLPASLVLQVTSPAGGEKLEVFQDEAYFWVEGWGLWFPYDYGPELRQQYALEYQGYGARQPLNAAGYISEVLIPTYRSGATNLRVEGTTSLAESD